MKHNSSKFLALMISVSMAMSPVATILAEDTGAVVEQPAEGTEVKDAEGEGTQEGSESSSKDAEQTGEEKTEDNNEIKEETKEENKDDEAGNGKDADGEADETPADVRPAPISGDAGVKIIYLEDGNEFGMFRVQGSQVSNDGSSVTVSIASSRDTYNKIFVGSVADYNSGKGTTVEGVENSDGFYNFTLTLPASAAGTNVAVVLIKTKDGSAYVSKDLALALPGAPAPQTTPTPEPTEAPSDKPAPISGAAGVKVNYEDDGTEFGMFRVQGSIVSESGEGITVSIASSRNTYNKIFVGSVADFEAGNGSVCEGIENSDGFYNFTLNLPASAKGSDTPIVLMKEKDGTGYVSRQLVLSIPGSTQQAPVETPAPTPEATPAPEVTPEATPTPEVTPAPEVQQDDRIKVVKESDGTEFKMFAAKEDETSAVLKGDQIEITFVTANVSYDRIYLGSKDDEVKEPVIMGTQDAATATWSFTFTVPASAKGTQLPIVPGNSSKGSWYSNQALLLNVPSVVAEAQPEVTPTPEVTPAPEVTPTPEVTPAPEVTPTPEVTPAPAVVPEDGIYSAEATSNASMFKIMACELVSNGGSMYAHITLSSTGYDALYPGSKESALAADDSALIKVDKVVTDADGKEQNVFTIPVSALDTPLVFASRSKRYYEAGETDKMWYDRTITISSANLVKTGDVDPTEPVPTPVPQPTTTPENPTPTPTQTPTPTPGGGGSDTNGSTSAVNSSTTLKDGVYKADSFSWSGGTGRLSGMSCDKITIRGGKAYATITIQSGKYIYVKASGSKYNPISQTSSTSTFEIPVALNTNNKIIGCTTAMSQAHEVEYSIYVGLNAAKNPGDAAGNVTATGADGSTTDNVMASELGNVEIDKDAPEIDGLKYQTSLKLEAAELFKIHFYENQITVVEIDNKTGLEKAEEVDSEEAVEEDFAVEEETSATTEDKDFFGEDKLLYVLAPEDAELPAGLEKEMMIIRTPVKNAYVASDFVLNVMDKLDAADYIEAVAVEKTDIESIAEAMEAEETVYAGTCADLDFKTLVSRKVTVAIVPARFLAHEGDEDAAEKNQAVKDLAGQLGLLHIAMIPDRANDEKESQARYEWTKLYSAVFGCEDKAADAMDALSKMSRKGTVTVGKK